MSWRSVFLVVLMAVVAWCGEAAEQLWYFETPLGNVDSSPAVADMNGDGRQDVIITTVSGSVVLIDSEGREVWGRSLKIPISLPPTVADLVEDECLEILVLNQAGTLFCLDGQSGDVIWKYDLPAGIEWGTSAITVYDLDGDGHLEVIVGDSAGHVVCLSATGERLWQYEGDHGHTYPPAIGPLSGSEAPSIFISGSRSPLIRLDASGKEVWRLDIDAKGAAPILADITNDGTREILTAIDNAVVAVDANGEVMWRFEMPKEIDGSLCVGDVNQDGIPEIYAIDLSGQLAAIAPDGAKLWTGALHERARRSPALADIDGDGRIEIVAAGYSGELFVFNADGEIKDKIRMPNPTNASPTVADLLGDGTPCILYACTSGGVAAWKWPTAKAAARVLWPEYRFTSARAGALVTDEEQSRVRITAADFGSLYAGENAIQIDIDNPARRAIRVEITTSRSGEIPRTTSVEVSDPVATVIDRYSLPTDRAVDLQIACRVYDGETIVARRSRSAQIVPLQKELADLATLLDAVADAALRLPDAYAALGRASEVRERRERWANRIAGITTLPDIEQRELRDLVQRDIHDFSRLLKLMKTAAEHRDAGSWPLRLSAANPWAPFGAFDEILEERLQEPEVAIEAFSGEVEDAALNVFNLGTVPLQVRVELDPLVLEGASETAPLAPRDVIAIHEVVSVPTQSLDLSADVLPRINSGYVLILPAWDARQLWFAVRTKGLAPGRWTSTIRLRTLEVESREFTAPLTIDVWDAALPETQALKHCNWGYVYRTPRMQGFEDETILDRVAHGNNVFVTGLVPRVAYDETGALAGELDYTEHDAYVRRYAPHGMILFHNTGGITGPGGIGSDAYRKAFVAWMRAWVAHLKDMGLGYDQFAMYPVDEPGLEEGLVERYLFFAQLAREADPKILMYTDPVARIRKEELVQMLPYVDIWCPNLEGFLLDENQDKLEVIKNSGKTLWTYECLDNAKHRSPLGYYRAQPWLAWHHGLTGIGFWSYCTSVADPWYRPENTLDYLMVYQGDGVVLSKRWEAVRDGIEDFDMLVVLRDAAQKARAENRAAEAVAKAETLLSENALEIARFCGWDEDGTTPGKDGLPGVRVVEDKRYAAVRAVRREMAQLLDALTP
ncbi:MAG: PQQ-binding-like beta-propeller repeat protein [Candidatus Hydrogenedentales bacterium]|jgi:outer membrane protein assembly factor BamB